MNLIVRSSLLGVSALLLSSCHRNEKKTAFDGQLAYNLIKTQLDFGPRIPGTEGWRRCGNWIVDQMKTRADTVIEQSFIYTTSTGAKLPMRNILARFRPKDTERILYITHWDTRPRSDGVNATKEQLTLPVPGANDGASGVALFIALADVLKKTPPQYGVDLLFVDGEDYGQFEPKQQDVLIGSTYFAAHLPDSGYRPIMGVLFDMIGDKDLTIYEEGNSVSSAPEVVSKVWSTAKDLGYDNVFIAQPKYNVVDDHIPMINVGLRVIDVIDIDYPAHHTPGDNLTQVSAKSLQTVGDVATAIVLGQ